MNAYGVVEYVVRGKLKGICLVGARLGGYLRRERECEIARMGRGMENKSQRDS